VILTPVSMAEAAHLVRPGDTIAIGGMTLYRRPVAFVRELLRQGTGDLTIISMTCGFESDLLVGAGRVRAVRTCYFGLEGIGLAPMFTKLAPRGAFRIIEESEASLAFGLRAALAGVGFMPARAWLGTDLLRVRPDIKMVTDPYSGEQLPAFPAIRPDVAIIHVPMADRSGNAAVVGNRGFDREFGLLAERVIVTTERIVESHKDFGREIDIWGRRVAALVLAPGGAHPTSCYPDYPLDVIAISDYLDACNRDDFAGYLERFLEEA